MTLESAQATLRAQMAKIPVNIENGTAFYKYLFTQVPDLRKFFKGSENINPNDVPSSERFHKQGQRLLLSVHVSVESLHNPMVFNAYVREMVNKHRIFKIPAALYDAFWVQFMGYVQQMTGEMNDCQKKSWELLAKEFNKEVNRYMTQLGI